MKSLLMTLLLGLIRMYQVVLSPLLGPACRYDPSCSNYAAQALQSHGIFKGSYLAAKRLGRCHPWSGSHGYDPVPPVIDTKDDSPKP